MSWISVKEFDSLQSYSQSLLTVAVNSELLLYTFCVSCILSVQDEELHRFNCDNKVSVPPL